MRRRLGIALLLCLVWAVPGLVAASFNAVLFPRLLARGALLFFAAQVGFWQIWVVLTPAIVAVTRRHPIERGQLRRSLAIHAMTFVLCAAAYSFWYVAIGLAEQAPGEAPEPWLALLRGNIGGRTTVALLLYAAVVGITIAVDERARRRERDLHAVHLQAELSRAQLQALQMQLQPHFLFNTLHTITMLIDESPPAARRTVVLLGDLLRQTLTLADVPEVTLEEELAALRRYLDIEETRFGDRLRVEIAVSDDTRRLRVPTFVLQPLVENAVRHGVAPRVAPGRIAVRARRDGGTLKLEVEDDGPGFAAEAPRDNALGLAATRERLTVLYGRRASLTCENGASGGALVTVTLPVADA